MHSRWGVDLILALRYAFNRAAFPIPGCGDNGDVRETNGVRGLISDYTITKQALTPFSVQVVRILDAVQTSRAGPRCLP